MLGVIIWRAEAESKAIIWCEDHGDLAFFQPSNCNGAAQECFDKGDLIQFELEEHSDLRLASNPRRIARHYCSDLGSVMETAEQVKASIEQGHKKESPTASAVIPFEAAKQLRRLAKVDAMAH